MLPIDDVTEEPRPGGRSPSSARRWVAWSVVALLLAAIVVYVARTSEELGHVRRLSAPVLIATSLLQFASQLFLNGSMLLPLQARVPALGFWELYLVRTGGSVVGSLVPVAGGLAVRLAYLRSRGLTYRDFTWATLLSNVLALAAAAAVAAVATATVWTTLGRPSGVVLAVAAGVFAMSVAALAAFEYLPRLTRHPRLRRWQSLADMTGLLASRRMTTGVFVLSVGRHGLNFVTFGLICYALTLAPADFLTGGLVYALTSPIRMVNFTPANLGVTEWVVALVGRALAFDLATGLIVSLAFRGVGLVAQGLGALVASAWVAPSARPR